NDATLRSEPSLPSSPVRVQSRDEFLDGEAGGSGVGQHAGHECAQTPVVLARGPRLLGRGPYERADAAPRLEHAGALEFQIHARDGVGVHPELDGELPDGGQLVAGAQTPGDNRRAQPTFELGIDRRPVPGVDGNQTHAFFVLVHWYSVNTGVRRSA